MNRAADSAVSVRLFTDRNSDFQAFVQQTWFDAYAGKMSFPLWSTDYFDWQFGGPQSPNRRLAAYVGDQLVGVLAGREADFQIANNQAESKTLAGAHYSWLSVSATYRGHRIAPLLDEARVAHERSLNSSLVVSYRFHGSKHSLAERTRNLSKAESSHKDNGAAVKQFNRRIGFWARPLQPTALRRWNHNRAEGWLAQLGAPVLPKVRSYSCAEIRDFQSEDVGDCLKVINKQTTQYAIRTHWTEERLHWQLNGHEIVQTVVAEEQGRVAGFVNFHLLPFQGRTRELIGILDLCCCDQLSSKRQRQLVVESLHRMKQQGAILALKSRTADVSSLLMLRTGFSPRAADSELVFQWMDSSKRISSSDPVQLLWR